MKNKEDRDKELRELLKDHESNKTFKVFTKRERNKKNKIYVKDEEKINTKLCKYCGQKIWWMKKGKWLAVDENGYHNCLKLKAESIPLSLKEKIQFENACKKH